MWGLTLSDRSFPGSSPEAIFEQARRAGILRLVVHDEALRPVPRRRLWGRRDPDIEAWRAVSQWAEALDYSRPRLHALRFERLRAGVRLTAWAIAPRPPQEVGASRIQPYALTAAAAASFLGASGLLLEGMDRWDPGEAMTFLRHLLPVLSGLRLILSLRLSEASPLLLEISRGFRARIRPWIALDLEERLPGDFPSLWDKIKPAVSMLMFRWGPEHLEWWDQEGRPILERTRFEGELVVTFPEIAGDRWALWKNMAQAHRLWPDA
ncbi:hypothetical protein HRbin22_00542 [Candidatus Thermoflexus japonica]|uniref:Uncharacterized protein n=1 Tax=Candidatus Thermoflexus japonica TaxID=2035417 RepID=A0A2H5Y4Q5_9CHLR|nr:hypothetical protein HRbin22_00542 [Candidatus Thermoflexus japonica]